VGAHATLYRDLIFYQPATHGILKPQNSSEALVRGVELEGALSPLRGLAGLSLSGSYTLLDTRILRGIPQEVGHDLPHRARHRLYARAALAPEPFEAHLEVHAVGRQFPNARELDPIPGATTWNAGASLRVSRRPAVRVHLEVKNLLDDRTLLDPLRNPLPSRTVLVTLRATPARAEGAP
jgi:iron complex outermembrane receptor protein